ncbi:hypothetical protein [Streptomyces roseolus]|uniref:hypothetical protein n=1 Tax=Streptomyces roseolus TaxID=67358 RepID=UPI0037936F92
MSPGKWVDWSVVPPSEVPPAELRWDLAADEAKRQALLALAEDRPTTLVSYEPVP